jgi:integrase
MVGSWPLFAVLTRSRQKNTYGFRKAELLSMKVRNVDLLGGTVGIDTSKNGDARKVSLTEETRKLLAACIAGKGPDDALFTRTELPASA